MTVGLWGCADSCAAVFPDIMFPIIPHPLPAARLSSRGSSSATPPSATPPSATPPSPPLSPMLTPNGGGGYFRLDVATPPLSARATSTPGLPASSSCPSPRRGLATPPPRPPSPPTKGPGVVVGEDIPLHAASRTFRPAELLADPKTDNGTMCTNEQLRLRLSADGHLDTDSEPTPRWVRRVRLADDCHSANVQLQLQQGSGSAAGCRVRAVRPLARGQSLQLWFADDLFPCLRLPFLAPHNIQGEKRYVCHRCGRTFEFPNPLKLHLSLDCGREDVTELWRRLHHHYQDEEDGPTGRGPTGRPRDSSAFKPYWSSSSDSGLAGLSLSGSLSGSLSTSSLNGSLSTSSSLNGSLSSNSHSGPSLFGAFHHWALSSPALRPAMGPALRPGHSPGHSPVHTPTLGAHPLLPRLPPPTDSLRLSLGPLGPPLGPPHAHQASYHQHASDMETLVSNLGRSKQGHLCIYCGKVYSRKYGLKIHIRTHTGFKPLKCKYCLRPFGDPSNLNKHVRLHAEGDTPYKCDLCGKVLVRRRDLERHIKSRHQEGGEWDMDLDPDNDDHDDVDVEVDVGDEAREEDEETEDEKQAIHCNGNSLKKRRTAADIAIPTA